MQTILITTIDSDEPIGRKLDPMELTELISARAYNSLAAVGVRSSVRTTLVPQKKEAWEQADAPRA